MMRNPSCPASGPSTRRCAWMPMSWTIVAARSSTEPLIAILNLRGRKANSGWKRRPLPYDLAHRARIDQLVVRDAGELVGRRVADAVAAGLDGVHLDAGEFGQDVGDALECRPVELDVLPRAEVTVTAVVTAGDERELAHLHGRQHAVRDGNPQHRCLALEVKSVLQPQRTKLILAQLVRRESGGSGRETGLPAGRPAAGRSGRIGT